MFTVELDDFDLFMLRHSLDFRKVVDGYLDEKTVGGDNPTDDIIADRARTMQSFIDYMLRVDELALGVSWAKAWLDRVKAKTGVTPGIYTSKSVLFSYD